MQNDCVSAELHSAEQSEICAGQPDVSVIMPVYNAQAFLNQTLDSLFAQTLHDIEVICVDDGSSDGSLALLQERAQAESRLQVIAAAHGGAGKARNAGLQAARGRYCCFVDADDFLEDDALARLVSCADANAVDVVIFGIDQYYEHDRCFVSMDWALDQRYLPVRQVFCPDGVDRLFIAMVGFTVNKLYNTAFLRGTGLQFPSIGAHEDMPFTYTAVSNARRAYIYPDALYHYRCQQKGTRSESTYAKYDDMLDALACLRNDLQRTGVWEAFERNYSNYAIYMIIWKFTVLSHEMREQFFRALEKDSWLNRLDINQKPEGWWYEPHYAHVIAVLEQPVADEQLPSSVREVERLCGLTRANKVKALFTQAKNKAERLTHHKLSE